MQTLFGGSHRMSAVMLVALAVAATSLHAQTVAWARRDVNGPSPRSFHAMAYDTARGVTVLYGGSSGGSETWEWDGGSWTQRIVSGPGERVRHAMAYDSTRGRTVLFGGHTDSAAQNGETWEWDGTAWYQRMANGPSPRRDHAMTFDSVREVAVLFGGAAGPYSSSVLNAETWEWNGTT